MTVGSGASLSGGVTGAVAQTFGFGPAFWLLSVTATAATLVLSLTDESDPAAAAEVAPPSGNSAGPAAKR